MLRKCSLPRGRSETCSENPDSTASGWALSTSSKSKLGNEFYPAEEKDTYQGRILAHRILIDVSPSNWSMKSQVQTPRRHVKAKPGDMHMWSQCWETAKSGELTWQPASLNCQAPGSGKDLPQRWDREWLKTALPSTCGPIHSCTGEHTYHTHAYTNFKLSN